MSIPLRGLRTAVHIPDTPTPIPVATSWPDQEFSQEWADDLARRWRRPLPREDFEQILHHPDEPVRLAALAYLRYATGRRGHDDAWAQMLWSAWTRACDRADAAGEIWNPELDALFTEIGQTDTRRFETMAPAVRLARLAEPIREATQQQLVDALRADVDWSLAFTSIVLQKASRLSPELLQAVLQTRSFPISFEKHAWVQERASQDDVDALVPLFLDAVRLLGPFPADADLKRLTKPLLELIDVRSEPGPELTRHLLDLRDPANSDTVALLAAQILVRAKNHSTASLAELWNSIEARELRPTQPWTLPAEHLMIDLAVHPAMPLEVLRDLAHRDIRQVRTALAQNRTALADDEIRQILIDGRDPILLSILADHVPEQIRRQTLVEILYAHSFAFIRYVELHPDLDLVLSREQFATLLQSEDAAVRSRAILLGPRLLGEGEAVAFEPAPEFESEGRGPARF